MSHKVHLLDSNMPKNSGKLETLLVAGEVRRRRLRWVVVGSIGMTVRDLWLASHGGGVTPRWMLRLETVSFAACALAGIASFTGGNRQTTERASALLGLLGGAIHGVRLIIFLGKGSSLGRRRATA